MSDFRLVLLARYLAATDHTQPPDAFWNGWNAIATDLPEQVWADGCDPALREAYCELLEAADDAGWCVPVEQGQP